MRSFVYALVFLMLTSAGVSADTAEGTIRQINMEAMTMTLSNGRTDLPLSFSSTWS